MTADPLFVSVTDDGNYCDENYHLQPGSPCIDADPKATDPDGSAADLGAYGGSNGAWTLALPTCTSPLVAGDPEAFTADDDDDDLDAIDLEAMFPEGSMDQESLRQAWRAKYAAMPVHSRNGWSYGTDHRSPQRSQALAGAASTPGESESLFAQLWRWLNEFLEA